MFGQPVGQPGQGVELIVNHLAADRLLDYLAVLLHLNADAAQIQLARIGRHRLSQHHPPLGDVIGHAQGQVGRHIAAHLDHLESRADGRHRIKHLGPAHPRPPEIGADGDAQLRFNHRLADSGVLKGVAAGILVLGQQITPNRLAQLEHLAGGVRGAANLPAAQLLAAVQQPVQNAELDLVGVAQRERFSERLGRVVAGLHRLP